MKFEDNGDSILFEVLEEDNRSDDLVGKVKISFTDLLKGTGIDQWFPLDFEGEEAG